MARPDGSQRMDDYRTDDCSSGSDHDLRTAHHHSGTHTDDWPAESHGFTQQADKAHLPVVCRFHHRQRTRHRQPPGSGAPVDTTTYRTGQARRVKVLCRHCSCRVRHTADCCHQHSHIAYMRISSHRTQLSHISYSSCKDHAV